MIKQTSNITLKKIAKRIDSKNNAQCPISYSEASRHLTGLRFKTDEDTFDKSDYQQSCPLGFENLAMQWLKIKESEVKKSSWVKINSHMYKCIFEWGNRNVKDIKLKDFQLLLNSLKLSEKTKPDVMNFQYAKIITCSAFKCANGGGENSEKQSEAF